MNKKTVEAELTERGTLRVETKDIEGKPLVIEKSLAANELQRLGAVLA